MINLDRANRCEVFVDTVTSHAMALLDPDGVVRIWNVGAQKLLGYAREEIEGKHFSCLYREEDIARGKPQIDLATALRQSICVDTVIRVRRDSTTISVQRTLAPLYDQKNALLGFSSVAPLIAQATLNTTDTTDVSSGENKKRILVVDDDKDVLAVTTRQLQSLGYDVFAAASGKEALSAMKEVAVDLLLTDISMPGGIGGRELAEQARLAQPNLKVLFASGYFAGALTNNGELEQGVDFLVKPYRKKELAAKLQSLLGATRA